MWRGGEESQIPWLAKGLSEVPQVMATVCQSNHTFTTHVAESFSQSQSDANLLELWKYYFIALFVRSELQIFAYTTYVTKVEAFAYIYYCCNEAFEDTGVQVLEATREVCGEGDFGEDST